MSRLRSLLEDVILWVCAIPLVLGMCALYWMCRLCGVEVDE